MTFVSQASDSEIRIKRDSGTPATSPRFKLLRLPSCIQSMLSTPKRVLGLGFRVYTRPPKKSGYPPVAIALHCTGMETAEIAREEEMIAGAAVVWGFEFRGIQNNFQFVGYYNPTNNQKIRVFSGVLRPV